MTIEPKRMGGRSTEKRSRENPSRLGKQYCSLHSHNTFLITSESFNLNCFNLNYFKKKAKISPKLMTKIIAFIEKKIKAVAEEKEKNTKEKEDDKNPKATHTPNPDIALDAFECFCKLGVEESKEEVISDPELNLEALEADAKAACEQACAKYDNAA